MGAAIIDNYSDTSESIKAAARQALDIATAPSEVSASVDTRTINSLDMHDKAATVLGAVCSKCGLKALNLSQNALGQLVCSACKAKKLSILRS